MKQRRKAPLGVRFAIVVGAVALFLGGCAAYHTTLRNPNVTGTGAVHEANQSFFLWGLAGGSDVDLDRMCPGGVASISSRFSFGDRLLGVLTVGIYTPMSVTVVCGDGTAHVVQVPKDRLAHEAGEGSELQ